MMNLWIKYKKILHETFPLHNRAGSVWATWESKGTFLTAKTYTAPYIIKSREVEIWNDKLKAIKVCLNRFDDETKQSFLELYDKVDADVDIREEE